MQRFLITASLLTLSVMGALSSSPAFAGDSLKARAEANWRNGSDRSILMTEFWVPFLQDEDSVFYGDLRMMGDDSDNREGNLGIGYRKETELPALGKGVAGAHGWVDRRITERGSQFHQVTLGVEWLGEDMDVRANGYLPLSDEQEYSIPNADPQGPALAGTGIVVDTNGTLLEEPQHGLDLELGWRMPFLEDHTDSIRAYGGGYYFDGDHTERVSGWRARLAADITPDVQIGARLQNDNERGSQGFLEATIRFPFGQKKSYRREGIRARLDESPERDIDIVTGASVTDSGDRVQVLNRETGAAQEVLHVDNTAAGGGDGSAENPFNTLAAAQAAASAQTIIYLHTGDGTSTNQDQGLLLDKAGQQLIGAGTDFIYDGARFATANGASPTSTLIAAAGTAPVITNVNAASDGITVNADDVKIAGVTVDGATRDGIVVEADGAAASAQNVTISNVTAQNNRMGVYIHGANSGSVSALVQGSVLTANSQHGIAVYDDTDGTFEADLGGGFMGSAGLNVLAGNSLEDLAVDYDGRVLSAQNNWWGQASGPDTDTPNVGIAPQIYYGAPINDGLAGHWTFDTEWTTNTTAYDRSGNNNGGTLLGGLSLANQVTGQSRDALNFNGPESVQVNDSMSLNILQNSLTISGWFNPNVDIANAAGPYPILLIKRPWIVGGYAAHFVRATGSVILQICTGATCPGTRSGSILANSWYYYTGVVDGQSLRLYINGMLVSSQNFAGTIGSSAGSALIMGSNFFDARMDDMRVYNRAIDPSEIAELYRMDASGAVDASGFLASAP